MRKFEYHLILIIISMSKHGLNKKVPSFALTFLMKDLRVPRISLKDLGLETQTNRTPTCTLEEV